MCEEFIRHAELHLQVRPAESSPSPPPTQRQLRQQPPAELIECVTQSRYEVKAWVRSNTGVLLRSGGGFDKAVYQEMLAALRPLTLSPPLNTVLIMPDDDEEIMRGMFERFNEVAKAGSILQVCVLRVFPGVSMVIQDATSDK